MESLVDLLSGHLQRRLLEQPDLVKRWGTDLYGWPEDQIRRALCEAEGIPFLEATQEMVDLDLFSSMADQCQEYGFLPTFRGQIALHVLMETPFLPESIRRLRNIYHREIHPIGTTRIALQRARGRAEAVVKRSATPTDHLKVSAPTVEICSWNYQPSEGVAFVRRVLTEAYHRRASDIFFEPFPDRLDIRLKVGKRCVVMPPISATHMLRVISDAKAFAGISTRESRGYRDGSCELVMQDGNAVNVRAVAQRSLSGETLTFRLLDKRTVTQLAHSLPFPDRESKIMHELIRMNEGMIFVVGPTGSGKTTTLWRCLLSLDSSELRIFTIEDPVEYRFEGFVQLPVSRRRDGNDDALAETFPDALRSCLRAAPDKILVGEIRDQETAEVATTAALTGHLIFSTLHTNNTTSVIPRLLDLGVSALNIRQTLLAVVAQRLAPRLCHSCRISTAPSERMCAHYRHHRLVPPERIYRNGGCPECGGSGIKGAVPVFELLVANDRLRGLIIDDFRDSDFRAKWIESGGKPLAAHALELAAEGVIAYDDARKMDPEFAVTGSEPVGER